MDVENEDDEIYAGSLVDEDDGYSDQEIIGNNFEASIAALEQTESKKTHSSLETIYEKLYEAPKPMSTCDSKVDDIFKRYPDRGYEAHYETLDETEILQWQSTFSYLRIEGHSISLKPQSDIESDATFYQMPSNISNNLDHHESCSLEIIGKALHITEIIDLQNEDSIDIQEGILEETIIIDQSENCLDENDEWFDIIDNFENQITEPEITQRQELIDSRFDELWKELIPNMKPLIEKLISLKR